MSCHCEPPDKPSEMGGLEPTVVQRVSPASITGLWEKIVWLHSVMASSPS